MLHNHRKRKPAIVTINRSRAFSHVETAHPSIFTDLEDIILRKTVLRNVASCPLALSVQDNYLRRRRPLSQFVSSLAFSPDGLLLIASAGENLHIFDPNRGRLVKSVWDSYNKEDVYNISFYSDKKFFLTTASGCIGFWDVRKLDSPLNCFKAHSKYITNILYDKQSKWLLSADDDGHLLYWYIPAFETKGVHIQEDHSGSLTNCPKLTQMCISEDHCNGKKLVLSSSTSSSLFIIDNLNLEKLAKNQELNRLTIGENFKMYLGMKPKITYEGFNNRVTYIDQDEFTPAVNVNLQNISHLESFPDVSMLQMRLTTSDISPRRSITGSHKRDWTVCFKLKNRSAFHSRHDLFHSYGSDVMHECLLYSIEEPRFCTLKEKKNCMSRCNRLIASPQKDSIKLLSFSESDFLDIEDAVHCTKRPHFSVSSIFSSSSGPQQFHEHVMLKFDTSVQAYPLCCKFSPISSSLLAVGDSIGRVSFYQPHL